MIKLEEVFDLNKVKFTDEELEVPYEAKEEEIWQDIKGYEGLYQVSNMGRVKSLERAVASRNGSKRTVQERILKPSTNHSGYLQVNLRNNSSEIKNFFVHRLVCEAFHENPEDKPCVNHIDENKTNNTASNLDWCTAAENSNHGTRTARSTKARSKSIGQYTTDGELVKVWQSTNEVERVLGFFHQSISAVARGKRKTAHGYIWKYIDEDS